MTRDQSQKILRCSIGLVSQRVRPRSDHISQRTGSRVRSRGRPLTVHGPTRSTINRWLRSARTPQSSCLVLAQTVEIVDKSSYRAPCHMTTRLFTVVVVTLLYSNFLQPSNNRKKATLEEHLSFVAIKSSFLALPASKNKHGKACYWLE